jgi:hypothetical protein
MQAFVGVAWLARWLRLLEQSRDVTGGCAWLEGSSGEHRDQLLNTRRVGGTARINELRAAPAEGNRLNPLPTLCPEGINRALIHLGNPQFVFDVARLARVGGGHQNHGARLVDGLAQRLLPISRAWSDAFMVNPDVDALRAQIRLKARYKVPIGA